MTTASVQTTKVQEEIAVLESELSELKTKLADDERALESLGRERADLEERIALGHAKASQGSDLARRIEETQMRASGLRSVLARKNARLEQIYPAFRQQQAEQHVAELRATISSLAASGTEAARKIHLKLLEILSVDLPAYDEARIALLNLKTPEAEELQVEIRASVLAMGREMFDQGVPKAAAELLGKGWRVRGDLRLEIKNLMPPKP